MMSKLSSDVETEAGRAHVQDPVSKLKGKKEGG